MIAKILQKMGLFHADTREIRRKSAIAFIIKGLGAGSSFAMTLVVTRQLGVEEAGLFFLAFPIILVATIFGGLGFDGTLVRFTALYCTTNNWDRINSLYNLSVWWTFLASLAIALYLWATAEFIAVSIFNEIRLAAVLEVMAFSVPVMTLFSIHASVLRGTKRIAEGMIVFSVACPLALLVMSLLVYPTSAAMVGWLLLCAALLALYLGFRWWRMVPGRDARPGVIDRAEILRSSIPLFVSAVLNQLIVWGGQIMVGAWSSMADVAVYNAASRTAMLMSFILVAINSIAAPTYAAYYHNKQHDKLRLTAMYTVRLAIIFGIGPLLLFLFFPEWVLHFFGAEFVVGSNVLRILAIAQFFNIATGSVGVLLAMTGHERLLRNNALIGVLTVLVLGVALIPSHGILGAAIVSTAGLVVVNLLSVWQVRRVLGFNTLAPWK